MRIDDDTTTGREAVISAITDSLHDLTDAQLLETMDAIRTIRTADEEPERRKAVIKRITDAIDRTYYIDLETLAVFAEALQRK